MSIASRTHVTFQSSEFNTNEPREHFYYPENYGDDLCQAWLTELHSNGVKCDAHPEQDETAWFFAVEHEGKKYTVFCAYRHDDNTWISWVEYRSLIPFFGKKGVPLDVVLSLDKALKALPVSDIKWHTESAFDACNEELGTDKPA